MTAAAGQAPGWLTPRRALLVVGLLSAVGLGLRLGHFSDTLIGDELSTLWIVRGGGIWHTITTVSSDAEISPPLYFVLAHLSAQLGSAPELVRLPALIFGLAAIPLTYLVGARAVGRGAGLLAATAMTLNPFMVYYSANARVYSLAIALLLGSTLAMLIAVRGGRRARSAWIAYGVCTCLAMYSHYTAAFVLAAQLLWLAWAHPEARRPALIANAAATLAFLPWLPSMLADVNSPTTDILSRLQGDGFAVKRAAVESWAYGSPGARLDQVPGQGFLKLAVLALVVAAVAGLLRHRRLLLDRGRTFAERVSKGMVLVLALALATPLAEALILLIGGTDLFGARNLNTSSGGLALATGSVLAAAGPTWGTICAVAALGVLGLGSARALEDTNSTIDFESPARLIDAEAGVGDVVLDAVSSAVSPVPLTPLDAHLSTPHREFRLYLPTGPAPFLEPPPPPGPTVREAFRRAGAGGSVYVVTREGSLERRGGSLVLEVMPPNPNAGPIETYALPSGSRIVSERSFDGLGRISLVVVEPGSGRVRRIS